MMMISVLIAVGMILIMIFCGCYTQFTAVVNSESCVYIPMCGVGRR